MAKHKTKSPASRHLIGITLIVVVILGAFAFYPWLGLLVSAKFPELTHASYLKKVSAVLEETKQRRDQMAAGLPGVVVSRSDGTHCDFVGLLGSLSNDYECQGYAYAVLGTDSIEMPKRALLDKLHSLRYAADWTVGPYINSITSYPDGKFVGSIRWDDLRIATWCSTGFGSSCEMTTVNVPSASHYSHYYVLVVGLPLYTQEKMAQIKQDLVWRKDPHTLPHVDYPSMVREGYFYGLDTVSNQIKFADYGVPKSVTLPRCADFRVIDEENATRQISEVKEDHTVALYLRGSCVEIMSASLHYTQ